MKKTLRFFKKITRMLALAAIMIAPMWGWGQTTIQNFGTGTGSHANQTGSTEFIPNPTGIGTTWARAGVAAASATVNLVAASNPLGTTGSYVRAVASTSTSVTKFSPWVGYTGGTEFYTSFKVLFGDASAGSTATSGSWTFYQGAGSMYSDASDFAGAQVFTGLRFTYGTGGALALTYRVTSTWINTGLSPNSFSSATVYTVEIVGNNKTSGTISYTYNGVSQTVAVQKFDLYINGTKIGDDLEKAQLPSNTSIVSGTFIGISSTSNVANIFVDDAVTYNTVPATIGAATPTIVPPNPTSLSGFSTTTGTASTTQTFTIGGTNLTANIVVTAPANYEVRENGTGTFGSSVSFAPSSGTVATKTIEVRISASAPVGSPAGNVVCSSTGATSQNVAVTGTVYGQIDWCNLQWPQNGTINLGGNFDVYARVFEPGITNAGGQGAGITAWIGYGTSSSDLSGYTWVAASYSGDDGTNNDEYKANIGAVIPAAGTYYYASRFQLGSSPYYVYGGFNGGFWDGTTNVSGTLTVNPPPQIDWANLQSPASGNINVGGEFNVYSQVFEAGLTEAAGQGAGISAWIGYSTTNTNPNTWTNWVVASFNIQSGNNDEYMANIATGLPAGTYYYASRFKYGLADYVYGGLNGFWNASTNISGVLTVTEPEPSAHVTGFTATANSSSTITVSWTDAVAANYLIKGSDVGYGSIIAPVDGTAEADGGLVKNVATGVRTYQFTGLTPNTPYFFKVYPYNGTGTDVNYKTDGSVPEANATTEMVPVLLAGWDFYPLIGGINDYGPSPLSPTNANSNVTIVGLTRGSGVATTGTGAANAWGGAKWETSASSATAITNDKFVTFSVTANMGYQISLTSIAPYNIRRSSSGPTTGLWQYQIDNGTFTDIGTEITWGDTTTSLGNAQVAIDLSSITSLQNLSSGTVVTFRIANYGASGTGTWYLNDPSGAAGDDFIINGFVNAVAATSTYTNTGAWTNATNWSNGLPGATTDVTITGNVTVDDVVECKDMTISSTGAVTVSADQGLSVNGNLLIESNATGTGSFIGAVADYTITGTKTIQRYLTGGWGDWNSGWHQISSPVAAQAISNFETTGAGNGYDFYGWAEPTNLWMNYKADGFSGWNGGTNFNVGQGYMVSYEAATSTKTFTGTLNAANVTVNSLSKTGGELTGWHLLGNPFASAIKWNDGNWALNNVAGNAKIWHEANKSYSDIAPNGIIPSAQGFMVQVSSATNSLTIPALARTHDATAFYKSSQEQVLLVAAETEGGSAQESKIIVNPMATEGFDFDYDSRFLAGYAPAFYSVADNQQLSTNSMAALAADKAIPLGFVKNNASVFTIELKESMAGRVVYLTDNLTGTTTNLTEQPVYSFTSAAGDQPDRFLLTFGAVGIGEPTAAAPLNAYLSHNRLFVTNTQGQAELQIFDLQGRLLQSRQLLSEGLHSEALTLTAGVYVVRLQSAQATQSVKVIVQ